MPNLYLGVRSENLLGFYGGRYALIRKDRPDEPALSRLENKILWIAGVQFL